ncbi:MAG: fibrinogen-like YCDxxxxGGGW domain-containing protein [Nocardioidaceae bacterium]
MGLFTRAFMSVALAGAALATAPVVSATGATVSVDPALAGSSADTAAGSCWEVKQLRPTAADGAYWLLTPRLVEPQRFYCDMTTDGGGWVLVGKGRENWLTDYVGQGPPAGLLAAGPGATVATTVQLGSRTVDALLDGGRVDALAEGVRLKRARNATGTAWQEVRMPFTKKDRWSWTFGAENPMSRFVFDGVTTNLATTSASFGTDTAFKRVINTTDKAHTYKLGFAYGAGVTGTTSPTGYLWASTNGGAGAEPFTEVYVRPRVTSAAAGFTAIPDAGAAAVARQRALRNAALVSPWGVSTRPGSVAEEFSVEVQAFTQSGNTMFVGGNFQYVQKDAAGLGQVVQPYLAGFDVTTGELVRTFRPVLNEQVRALATLPDGTVVAAGDFTAANGQPATAVVGLDPVTGATRPGFKVSLQNRITGGTLRVRSLDVEGPWLYIGGAVTHFAGGTKPTTYTYMRQLGRVQVTDGTPGTGWNPNLSGTVAKTDGSADGKRLYAAGFFTDANGVAARNAAALLTAPGAGLATPAWSPTWSSAKSYQQAIQEVGKRVWVGGSQHSLFSFDTSTFNRLSGNIAKPNGDTQSIATRDGLIFAGCHCAGFEYENAYVWSTLGPAWTRADSLKWFGMWDAETGDRIPDFTPNLTMRKGNGIWALTTDTLGNVWAGGDVASVRTTSGNRFSGGFARFPMVDTTPPPAPTDVRIIDQSATTLSLAWGTVSGDASPVHYQVLRDDRPIAFTAGNTGTITVPRGGSNRFFVRAVDSAGNASSSSAVLVPTAPVAGPAAGPTTVVIENGSAWQWRYADGEPPAGWNTPGFDASSWATGDGVLGFGAPTVVTNIDTFASTSARPVTAYFTTSFQVADPAALTRLTITSVADDGAVFYVNGVEVKRTNIADGPVTSTTFASSARRYTDAGTVVVDVPASQLVAGTNVISVETHLNYRGTPDATFDLKATLTS